MIRTLARGLARRCPRCGRGALFDGWYAPRERCAACGLELASLHPHTWAFMYISTAGMTGVIVVAMLLTHPPSAWLGRVLVLAGAIVLIIGTLPHRKGVALALEFLLESKWHAGGSDACEPGDDGHDTGGS